MSKSGLKNCRQCDYQAKYRSHLQQHVKSIHEGVKHPCHKCDYKASEKGSLLRHIKSKHIGVEYPCDQCHYKATHTDVLIHHSPLFLKFVVYRI